MDAPTRWDEIGWILQDTSLKIIADATGVGFDLRAYTDMESLTKQLFAMEAATRVRVTEACLKIAASPRSRHSLPKPLAYLVCRRAHCALDFTGMIFPETSLTSPIGEIPEHWTDEKVIRWLLTDLWERRFDHYLKLTAHWILTPFAWYGINPAAPHEKQHAAGLN